ncbi:MAG: autotransporter domain-containing protein, partial [Elusimicrobiota bacterium]|nr:autotransporter domain-containing protein [Elusimicrobiota bacterium]
ADNKIPVWAQVNIKGLSYSDEDFYDKFNSNGRGALAGIDLFEFDNKLIGAYIGYENNTLKQGKDKGNMDAFEIGGYGALFGLFDDKMSLKGNIGFSAQVYDAKREIKDYANEHFTVDIGNPESSFNAYVFSLGAQVQLLAKQYNDISIEPFLGLQNSLSINQEIKEKGGGIADLIVDADAYFRMQSFVGAKVFGAADALRWYGRWYIGILIAGSQPQYDISFAAAKDAGKMSVYGSDEEVLSMGFGAGGEYNFNPIVSAFANIDANFSGGASQYFVSIGMTLKISAPERKEPAPQEAKFDFDEQAKLESVGEETIDEQEYMSIDRDITPEELSAKKQEAISRREGRIIKSFILKNTFPSSVYRINTDAAKKEIEEIADFVKKHQYKKVTIEGHTDSSGSEIINQRLSRMRARSVYEELFKNGIDATRMEYIGFGSALPAATNKTVIGKDKNRRVEIFVE